MFECRISHALEMVVLGGTLALHSCAGETREAFVYFIHEGKIRAPGAAADLISRVR
jgi:hypothetical protein